MPSLVTREIAFSAFKRRNQIDIHPSMMNVSLQIVIGTNVLHTWETKFVFADNNQYILDKLSWATIAKLPL